MQAYSYNKKSTFKKKMLSTNFIFSIFYIWSTADIVFSSYKEQEA